LKLLSLTTSWMKLSKLKLDQTNDSRSCTKQSSCRSKI
jgi:hypothetical protein